jgi:hypothetical protein
LLLELPSPLLGGRHNVSLNRPPTLVHIAGFRFVRRDLVRLGFGLLPGVVGLVLAGIWSIWIVVDAQHHLDDATNALAAIQREQAPFIAMETRLEQANSTLTTLRAQRGSSIEPMLELRDLNNHLPASVRLRDVVLPSLPGVPLTLSGEVLQPVDLVPARRALPGLHIVDVTKKPGDGVYTWDGSYVRATPSPATAPAATTRTTP